MLVTIVYTVRHFQTSILFILFDTTLDFSPNFGKTSFCVLLEHGALFKTLFIPVLVFLRHILGYPTVTKSTTIAIVALCRNNLPVKNKVSEDFSENLQLKAQKELSPYCFLLISWNKIMYVKRNLRLISTNDNLQSVPSDTVHLFICRWQNPSWCLTRLQIDTEVWQL